MSSFVCQDILPGGLFHPQKCGTNDWLKSIKIEEGTAYNSHYKSFSPHYGFEKVIPSFHGNEANTAAESIFSVNNTRHPYDMGGPNSGSSPFFRETTLGIEDFTVFNTASTIQGLSRMSASGCALSLLSSKSQNSSNHLSGIPVARALVIPGSNTHYNTGPVFDKLPGVSSQASTGGVSNKFSSSGNNSVEGSNLGSILMSDSSDAANFDVSNGIYRGLDIMNPKDRLSCEDGATIDLLQLSSQLQQVEHQRQSMQVKDENDSFCWLRIT